MQHPVFFTLNDEDWLKLKEIRNVILRQYNKLRGVYGHVVIDLAYTNPRILEKRKNVGNEFGLNKNSREKLINLFNKIPDQGTFYEKMIDHLIEKNIGISKPTINSYKNLLIANRMIDYKDTPKGRLFFKGTLPDWLKGD